MGSLPPKEGVARFWLESQRARPLCRSFSALWHGPEEYVWGRVLVAGSFTRAASRLLRHTLSTTPTLRELGTSHHSL